MSRPRQILPGSTYLVTRRCAQRLFLLRPSRTVNQVFAFCTAVAAQKFGLLVHSLTVLSNHFHAVLTDPQGNLPRFMAWLDLFVAKALNADYGRWENFWAPGSYSAVRLVTQDDVLAELVYCLTNPVAAGLVARAHKWPGLTTAALRPGNTISAARPERFFRDKGPLPESAVLQITRPPGFDHLSDDQFFDLLEQHVAEREDQIRSDFRSQGRRFAGVHALRRLKPTDSPNTREPRRKLNPRIACKDPGRRVEALDQLKAFETAYREALLRWRAGDKEVQFPLGTYYLRLHAGVKCRSG
ncbi:MAG: hypothetical protein ABIO70_28765 [Pseudomonadota bacterium]